jgi:hypothetical protein
MLAKPPRVFSLQLAWESHTEPADAIAATLAAMVPEEVDLGASKTLHLKPDT